MADFTRGGAVGSGPKGKLAASGYRLEIQWYSGWVGLVDMRTEFRSGELELENTGIWGKLNPL